MTQCNGLLAGPSCCAWHTHPCSRPKQTNSHVFMQVQNRKKPEWKLQLHFYFTVSEGSQGDDLFETVSHSPGLFSVLLAEAAEMTAVMLVTKMHLHRALTLYQNDQLASHLSNSLLGTHFSLYYPKLCSSHSYGDKNLHILLPILQVICSSILLNKIELTGYEFWFIGVLCFGWVFFAFFSASLFKEEKRKKVKC